jgi:predicted nuclease with TOPRIM domain
MADELSKNVQSCACMEEKLKTLQDLVDASQSLLVEQTKQAKIDLDTATYRIQQRHNDVIAQVYKERDAALEKAGHWEAAAEEAADEKCAWQAEAADAETRRANAANEVEGLESLLNESEKQASQLVQDLAKEKSQASLYRKAAEANTRAFKLEIVEVRQEASELRNERETLQTSHKELQQKLEAHIAEASGLREDRDVLQAQVASLQKDFDEFQKESEDRLSSERKACADAVKSAGSAAEEWQEHAIMCTKRIQALENARESTTQLQLMNADFRNSAWTPSKQLKRYSHLSGA